MEDLSTAALVPPAVVEGREETAGEAAAKADVHMCVECEDVPANVRCEQCTDCYCKLCFMWLHKRGARAKHRVTPVNGAVDFAKDDVFPVEGTTEHFVMQQKKEKERELLRQQQGERKGEQGERDSSSCAGEEGDVDMAETPTRTRVEVAANGDVAMEECATEEEEKEKEEEEKKEDAELGVEEELDSRSAALLERCKWIPLRLTGEERALLRMVEGALDISEYTDNVDVSSDYYGWRVGMHGTKDTVIREQLVEAFSLLSGMFVAANFRQGQRLVGNKSFKDNEEFFQHVFELARRYKITSPEKMRGTYGKLMHLLQDANTPDMINFDAVVPIQTVAQHIRRKGCSRILLDAAEVEAATAAIDQRLFSAKELHTQAEEKAAARERLLAKHASEACSREEVELVLDSIGDANSFIVANRTPVEEIIAFLERYFDPNSLQAKSSLEIRYGMGGSKLSHSHKVQYNFVRQSLLLWREIQGEMYKLWLLADADLLSDARYRLCNTGQGLNRVQPAPRISRAMNSILRKVQAKLGGWIGLSVVHLGDRDVPNALVFIDKYTQVPRILNPICCAISNLEKLVLEDPTVAELVHKVYGGLESAKISILRDYFRHGFDGSGSDGGSCIDGRLTSSWNWCSKLQKKKYYYIFLLTSFEGFDGSFRR